MSSPKSIRRWNASALVMDLNASADPMKVAVPTVDGLPEPALIRHVVVRL